MSHTNVNRWLLAPVAVLASSALLSPGAWAAPGSDAKVTICHATSSAKNPYVVVTVSVSAAGGRGNGDHFAHARDIIPPVNGHSGLNWDAAGTAIYAAGCVPTTAKKFTKDADGDGVVDLVDPDDDNDGLADEDDRDSDADGRADAEKPGHKPPKDTDGDGIPNSQDVDDDGDCVVDALDDDADGEGVTNAFDRDADNDGVKDSRDVDDDSDGIPDYLDPDPNGDGIPGQSAPRSGSLAKASSTLQGCQTVGIVLETDDAVDTDADGLLNSTDPDDDNDGIPDEADTDQDGDGLPNAQDPDDDGDGIRDSSDADTALDQDQSQTDTDGDGKPDSTDPDLDGDGVPNGRDQDADGDGQREVAAQTLDAGVSLPPALRQEGSTVLLPAGASTRQGQPISVEVRCFAASPSTARGNRSVIKGDAGPIELSSRSCHVGKQDGAVTVDLQVNRSTIVIVDLYAPAIGDRRALHRQERYVVN